MSRPVLNMFTRLTAASAPRQRLAPLVLALVAGLAAPVFADSQHTQPEPIAPAVDGALYDGFSRNVTNGNTIAAFHTDHAGRFTTTLQLGPGAYLFFPDCRGGSACENLRFADMKAARVTGAGKLEPAQAMKGTFRSLTIDTSELPGVTTVRFTGRVEADHSHSGVAMLKIGGGGLVLIPGADISTLPGHDDLGDHDADKGRSTDSNSNY